MTDLLSTLKEHEGLYSEPINDKIVELILLLEQSDNYTSPNKYVFQYATGQLLRRLILVAKDAGIDVSGIKTSSWNRNRTQHVYTGYCAPSKSYYIANAINRYYKEYIWEELEPHEKSFLCSLGEKALERIHYAISYVPNKLEEEGVRYIALSLYQKLITKYKLARRYATS